jgi:hypothetical protein
MLGETADLEFNPREKPTSLGIKEIALQGYVFALFDCCSKTIKFE